MIVWILTEGSQLFVEITKPYEMQNEVRIESAG